MEKLVFPERVIVRLIGPNQDPVRIPDVLIVIHVFALRKNDFFLQPFITNADGVANITKGELLAEAAAHYDSGLMDYSAIEESRPLVEIRPMSIAEIEAAVKSRSQIWTSLLRGETERWSSIEQLVDVYRRAANDRVAATPTRMSWHLAVEEHDCPLAAVALRDE